MKVFVMCSGYMDEECEVMDTGYLSRESVIKHLHTCADNWNSNIPERESPVGVDEEKLCLYNKNDKVYPHIPYWAKEIEVMD